jgi:two-component sensor histidine kinase
MAASFDDLYDLTGTGISLKIAWESGIVVDLDTCTTVGTILNELVANSVEHAFAGVPGRISVSLSRSEGGGCALLVADDGPGMVPSKVKENTGLRTVRQMLTRIGGRLDLETGPGKGARWSVSFGSADGRHAPGLRSG